MSLIRTIEEVHRWRQDADAEGRRVGFVPTMGALHEGHLSLVREATRRAETVAVSIFVNPLQFGPSEDFAAYPRDLAGDVEKLRPLGASMIFAPEAAALYPAGHATFVVPEGLGEKLCGAHRPGHFRGVLTVLLKLFHLVRPHVAVFGQKDFQQTVLVRRMVADLHLPVEIVVPPTVREPDGLALSSRNAYLDRGERSRALCLSRALAACKASFDGGERGARALRRVLDDAIARGAPDSVDYATIVHPSTLDPVDPVEPGSVAIIALRIGRTRLIDNAAL